MAIWRTGLGVAAACLSLAACHRPDGRTGEDARAPEAAVASAPVRVNAAEPHDERKFRPEAPIQASIGGVDLRRAVTITGEQPDFVLSITPRTLRLTGKGRAEITARNAGPRFDDNDAVFEAKTPAGLFLRITLSATPCTGGLSGRTAPLTAVIEAGDEVLHGCADSTATLKAASEAPGSSASSAPPLSTPR